MNVSVLMYGQDDPKKCTAARMVRLGLASKIRRTSDRMLVLDPFAPRVLLPRHDIRSIAAIDCSWTQADRMFLSGFAGVRLRLPPLFAGNPVNYSKVGKLTTVEAICGALFLLGRDGQAHDILGRFRWGHTFYELNCNLLGDYSRLHSESELEPVLAEYGLVPDAGVA